jgi:NAD(P)-dependent dehydrogenase (short-subunit alcohol dehydrogenase family)
MTAQVWFITGSSRGLGRSVAEEVLGAGRKVVATARKTNALDDLAERYGARLLTVPLDVTDPAQAAVPPTKPLSLAPASAALAARCRQAPPHPAPEFLVAGRADPDDQLHDGPRHPAGSDAEAGARLRRVRAARTMPLSRIVTC